MTPSSTTTRIPHPASTRFHDDDGDYNDDSSDGDDRSPPSAKRRKTKPDAHEVVAKDRPTSRSLEQVARSPPTARSPQTPSRPRHVKAGKRDEDGIEEHTVPDGATDTSQLETALPPVTTDDEAIEAYEAYKAGLELSTDGDDGGNPNGSSWKDRVQNRSWQRGRSSIYVDAFNLALDTVLDEEGHLFDEAETAVFGLWRALSYEAQYLYVRLFLRKTFAWFRIGRLGYYDDIADMAAAVAELQEVRDLPKVKPAILSFPGETELPEHAAPLADRFSFAECSEEHIHSLDEAGTLLLLDELKAIAKDAKVHGKNKKELLHNLRRTSGRQAGLGFLKRSETDDSTLGLEADGRDPPSLNDGGGGTSTPTRPPSASSSRANRDAHFTRKILDQTGRCMRLALTPLKLFERAHLVFYRSTGWTEKSLTTLVLAKISRRNFPPYIVSRSANIFASRDQLLEFEASVRTQFRVDSVLEFSGTPGRKQHDEVLDIFEAVYPRWKVLLQQEQAKEDNVYETGEGAYLRRFSPAWVYTRIIHKALGTLARFKQHRREHDLLTELLGQKLFHAARRGVWYQRKALLEEHYMAALAEAGGRGEEAHRRHWKRIALQTCERGLQDNETHVVYHYDLQKRVMKLERQLRVPRREQHEFTHVRLRHAVERDVEGIKIEKEDTSGRRASLRRKDSDVEGRDRSRSQTRERSAGAGVGATDSAPTSPGNLEQGRAAGGNAVVEGGGPASLAKRGGGGGGKTVWHDELDTNEQVSVESMCLSHYRKQLGWKGYHSEGGILRVLFGLLFYEILFDVYVPNVFQTAYQTCPLDLHTDAFYGARLSEINVRLNDVANGQAPRILQATWAAHFERRTCIVGVRWDEYEFDDLLEIVQCFPADALATILRVMAQEYAARGGGVPDLFLWKKDDDDNDGGGGGGEDQDQATSGPANHQDSVNGSRKGDRFGAFARRGRGEPEEDTSTPTTGPDGKANGKVRGKVRGKVKGKVMFVEVKSENDRLSDSQRLWISVMLNAGIDVELCHAVAREVRTER